MAEAYGGRPLTYGASIFGALIKLFTNPPEGFDPDDLVPTLRQVDMLSVGEVVKGLTGGDTRAAILHKTVLKGLGQIEEVEQEMPV